jgi:hypothetical protein
MFGPTRWNDLTPAQRAHTRRILWLFLAYLIVLPPLIWLRAHRQLGDTVLLTMAIAASLPILGMFASWGRYISDERDEYHQTIVLRRIAVATNATMGAAIVWGFLQTFGVMPLVEAYWVPFVWIAMQGAFGCFATFARRGTGD